MKIPPRQKASKRPRSSGAALANELSSAFERARHSDLAEQTERLVAQADFVRKHRREADFHTPPAIPVESPLTRSPSLTSVSSTSSSSSLSSARSSVSSIVSLPGEQSSPPPPPSRAAAQRTVVVEVCSAGCVKRHGANHLAASLSTEPGLTVVRKKCLGSCKGGATSVRVGGAVRNVRSAAEVKRWVRHLYK